MKKAILFIITCFAAICANAQESTTDYIYSADGFEIKKVIHPYIYSDGSEGSSNNSYSSGLYSRDGKILVSATGANYTYDYQYVVRYGTEVIASRAFQYLRNCVIFIPSTVKYIAPDALETGFKAGSSGSFSNRFAGIYDKGVDATPNQIKAIDAEREEAEEVARYNLQGMKITEAEPGVNIIQMSDNTTAKKVLVK